MVYIISKSGTPLMPTSRNGWVRRSLNAGKAKVVKRFPFTIQLSYASEEKIQELSLGQDIGFKNIGASVVSPNIEVFSAEYTIRTDVSANVSSRRMYRRTRRGNKLRYRKPRFDNRKRKVLQPSIKQKVETHERIIINIKKILPIKHTKVEANNFDMAKMKNPVIKGKDYQEGVQKDFYNTKQYVLARDGYTCQSKETTCSKKLHVHHIKFRSEGGSNAPDNLVTVCEKHHGMLHKGSISLDIKKHKSLKTATMMNVVRSQLLKRNPDYLEAYGYETKYYRENMSLSKTHANDAFIVAGGREQIRTTTCQVKQKRRNDRSIQKNRKGYAPSIRRERYKIQPKDVIKFEGILYQTSGIHCKGARLIILKDNKKKSVAVKNVAVIFNQRSLFEVKVSNSSQH